MYFIVNLFLSPTDETICRVFVSCFLWTRVDAESNSFTVTLRVVGGDEKGSLESETVKYANESYGTRTRKRLRWRGPVAIANGRPVLSSERTHQINKPTTVRE
jgi:hypothetical protein